MYHAKINMPHVEIFLESLFFGRFRNCDDSVLDRPPNQNLGRSSGDGFGDRNNARLRNEFALSQRTMTLQKRESKEVNLWKRIQ
jgi:hypothetical protein